MPDKDNTIVPKHVKLNRERQQKAQRIADDQSERAKRAREEAQRSIVETDEQVQEADKIFGSVETHKEESE